MAVALTTSLAAALVATLLAPGLLAVTTLPATALPATALPATAGPPSTASTTSADATDAADAATDAAAARITRLTAEYRRHSSAAASAAADLAAAWALVAAAEGDADASGSRLGRARSDHAASALALYAYGAGARTELTLLTADSPEDGLWRLAVGAPLGERLLAGAARRAREAGVDVATDDAKAASAERAAGELTEALVRLRREETSAGAALEAARTELARLTAEARRRRAAQEAAAALARAQGDATAARLASSTPVTALGIPAEFEQAYRGAAATCPGLPWTLLAAVGQIESGHGRNNGPSSAGAIGPMQFMPATFDAYGVDGDADGTKDAWDPQDAVFSAARYLCASGAGQGSAGIRRAVFAYNHAQWYVDLVLGAEQAILNRARP